MEILTLIPENTRQYLNATIRAQIEKLHSEQKNEFIDEYNRCAKTTGIAYLCWFFLGMHYIYLKSFGSQLLFWITGGGFLLWLIWDAFRMNDLVGMYNRTLAKNILKKLC